MTINYKIFFIIHRYIYLKKSPQFHFIMIPPFFKKIEKFPHTPVIPTPYNIYIFICFNFININPLFVNDTKRTHLLKQIGCNCCRFVYVNESTTHHWQLNGQKLSTQKYLIVPGTIQMVTFSFSLGLSCVKIS